MSKIEAVLILKAGAAAISAEAFRLYTLALIFAGDRLTDGRIAQQFALETAGGYAPADELVAAGLWTPAPGGWAIADYLRHHRSAAHVRSVSEARRSAGAKGGHAKQAKQIATRTPSNLLETPAQEAGKPPAAPGSNLLDAGSNLLEAPGQEAAKPKKRAGSKLLDPGSKLLDEGMEQYALIPALPVPARPEVLQLCERLVQRMVENECAPPPITKAWLDAARLMLDKDKRDFQKAMNLIDWCQRDEFWRGNIRSMPTFREKYDQLRLQAVRDYRVGNYIPEGMTREEAVRAKVDQRIGNTEVVVAAIDVAYDQLKARMEGVNGS